jgi:hypothetical protein
MSASNYYLGQSIEQVLGDSPRFLYLLRRNDDGEIFFVRSDQLKDKDSITINESGDILENFEDFEAGKDFLDGIDEDHETVYKNLVWPQYVWTNQNLLYYIDDQGQFVKRINQNYQYFDGISS